MRGAGVLGCVTVLLVLHVPPALAANSLSVVAPPSAREGEVIHAQVSGETDEPVTRFKAFVQTEPCQPDVVTQEEQPGAIEQNARTVHGGATGPFEFTALLRSDASGTQLTGVVNVCSYLYYDTLPEERVTLATDFDAVEIEPAGAPSPDFGMRVREKQRMKRGRIRILATCPAGCGVRIEYKGLRGERSASRSLGVSNKRKRIRLRLDRRTRRAVRARRREGGGRVRVTVEAVATAPNGEKHSVARTVRVR